MECVQAEPVNHNVGTRLDGFPVAQDDVRLFQAAALPAINQHRLTGGFGRQDVMLRGLDFDFFAGGLFSASDNFGPNTSAKVAAYYSGFGLTWRFGAARHPE